MLSTRLGGMRSDTDNDIQIALTEPITTWKVDLEEYHLFKADISHEQYPNTNIEDLIRINHLNNEKNHILKLYKKF